MIKLTLQRFNKMLIVLFGVGCFAIGVWSGLEYKPQSDVPTVRTLPYRLITKPQQVDLDIVKQIESSGRWWAYNRHSGAIGLYQISPVCLEEYNYYHKDRPLAQLDLWMPIVNERVAEWYLYERIPDMLTMFGHDITVENVLYCYNVGIGNFLKRQKPAAAQRYLEKYNKLKGEKK